MAKRTSAGIACGIPLLAASGPLLALRTLPWWWSAGECACAALALAMLALTHFSDPGIIPPHATPDPLLAQIEAAAQPSPTSAAVVVAHVGGREYRRVTLEPVWTRVGGERRDRYCTACNIWRPPHAHHCKACGHCVAYFDHHCDSLAACIGGLNHRWFTLFLLSALGASALLLSGASLGLAQLRFAESVAWQSWGTVALLAVYLYVTCLTLFGCVHCGLMLCDARTKDILMRRQAWCPLCAYGWRGMFAAWRRQWCGAMRLRSSAYKNAEQPQRAQLRRPDERPEDGAGVAEPLLPASEAAV